MRCISLSSGIYDNLLDSQSRCVCFVLPLTTSFIFWQRNEERASLAESSVSEMAPPHISHLIFSSPLSNNWTYWSLLEICFQSLSHLELLLQSFRCACVRTLITDSCDSDTNDNFAWCYILKHTMRLLFPLEPDRCGLLRPPWSGWLTATLAS